MMKIKITQEVINKCVLERIGWYNPCPITRVMRSKFPREYVIVNGIHILAGKEYRVPRKAVRFMVDWEHKSTVKPLSFFLVRRNSRLDKIFTFIEKFYG